MHNNANPYGLGQVKKSFVHFIIGKGSTAVLGVGLLLLTVRALPAEDYGIYIALLAAFEIIQLVSNFGLFSAAYRYVPELRVSHRSADLRKLLYWLTSLRILTLVISVALLALFVQELTATFELKGAKQVILLYGIVIVAEGFSRFLDILFDSLLQQKYSQMSIFFRNGLRALGIVALISTTKWNVTINDWVHIEIVASLAGAAYGAILLQRYITRLPVEATGSNQPNSGIRRYLNFVGPSYISQIIGAIYGPETTKLILTKATSALQVGAFGFAASLSGMLQRYLPVFLLLGLVRPLFVSVNSSENRGIRLNQLSNLVLKLNIFVLFPAIAYVLASGDNLAQILSGGKFSDSANYIVIFMVLLVFQTWHAVLGLVTLAVEDGLSGFHGTLFGLIGLGVGLLWLPTYGPMSLCVGLILSEIIWCASVTYSLNKNGVPIKTHWNGIVKILIFSAAGYFATLLINNIYPLGKHSLLSSAFTISTVFLGFCYWQKPFSADERGIINKILPRPIFVW